MSPAQRRRGHPRLIADVDVVGGEQFVDEAAEVFGGDAVGELTERQVLALALEFGGHDDVHAVRLALHLLVDPGELLVELIGGV